MKQGKQANAWFVIVNDADVVERTLMPRWKAKAFAKAFNVEATAAGIDARAFVEAVEWQALGSIA